jgi:hypothetical protein
VKDTVARVSHGRQAAGRTGSLQSPTEVSGYLVDSAAFKAVGTGDPRPAGSIPVHLRQNVFRGLRMFVENALTR